jgi:pyrimidine nucleoside transport protein
LSSLAASVKKRTGLCGCVVGANYRLAAKIAAVLVAVSLYNAYIVYAIHYHVSGGRPMDWCGGLGFLIILTLIVYAGLFYFHVAKRCVRHYKVRVVIPGRLKRLLVSWPASILATLAVTIAIVVFLVLDSARDRYRCVPFKISQNFWER